MNIYKAKSDVELHQSITKMYQENPMELLDRLMKLPHFIEEIKFVEGYMGIDFTDKIKFFTKVMVYLSVLFNTDIPSSEPVEHMEITDVIALSIVLTLLDCEGV